MKVYSDKVLEAIRLATELHKDQVRKGTAIPYITHPWAVASLVAEHGGDEDQVAAAFLHDSVEDHSDKISIADILRQFGERVADIVDGCTDSWSKPKPEWRPRKEAYLAHLRTAPPYVKLVASADKLHNARSILSDLRTIGSSVWTRFSAGPGEQLWYYRSCVDDLRERHGPPIVKELERVVGEIDRWALITMYRPGTLPAPYPMPDRSTHKPNSVKTPENDQLDLGWYEGLLSDGRPFRLEFWCQDQISMLTYFFSTIGLEDGDRAYFEDLLVREGLLKFKREKKYASPTKWMDPSGNELWSVNVVLGDEDGSFVQDKIAVCGYKDRLPLCFK